MPLPRAFEPQEDPLTAVPSTGVSPDAPAPDTAPRVAVPPPRSRFAAVHPPLFAAYAVLFLWSQNLGETNPRQVVLPLLAVVLGAALLTILLGVVFRDRRRGALVASPIVIGLLMYGHVDHVLPVPGVIQQLGWIALVVLAVVAAFRLGAGWITRLDTALVRIATLLVIVTLVIIVPYQVSAAAGRSSIGQAPVAGTQTSARKRDVYWLVFDRYGSERALELQYGVKNDLPDWLTDHGFTVLPDSHANYIRTVLSLSTTLQMSPLDELAALQGPASSDLTPVNDRLQDPLVARQFKALGYRYDHIGSWWDPTRTDAGADANYALSDSPIDFVDALYDASAGPALTKRLHLPAADERRRQYDYSVFGLDALERLRDEPGPKFVMAHILLPHPPLVFKADGAFMDSHDAARLSANERYRQQLDYTNRRIREIIGGLLALPEDQRPIIILQADEGPWPPSYGAERKTSKDWAANATDRELEQKYGILNAWYLPEGQDGLGLYPGMTAINTFPVLFSRYFGIDYPTLPDRSYSSHDWAHPYDLTDITDRLTAAP